VSHRPDRPIDDPADDRLGRDGFVARLARALVTPDGRASGVVVGLTGPWGSGKSSILKLLAKELEATAQRNNQPEPVVVRFDPWLVSGRDDVITQFFAELLATIRVAGTANGRHGDTLRDLGAKLAGYAKDLAPGAGLFSVVPGVGAAAAGAAKVAETLLTRDRSLAAQHRELTAMLDEVTVPIVVLIDELDRVEDAEVRAVAQLVRAVADFPGISYLLAYDRNRVVEALGGGDRGNAYLEKIVQLQIPLPVSLNDEMRALFFAELEALSEAGHVPAGWREDARLNELVGIVLPTSIATPRDVRRIVGSYEVMAPMVRGEVDWVDLLGYCILLAKVPHVVDELRRKPEEVVVDPLSEDARTARYIGDQSTSPEDRLRGFGVPPEHPAAPLMGFLFPRFSAGRAAVDRGDAIRFRRPLLTLLRLGMLPGAVPRQEVRDFLGLEEQAMTRDLRHRFETDRLESFLDRFDSVYSDAEDSDPQRTWRSIGSFLEPETPAWPTRFVGIADVLRAFERTLFRTLERRPLLRQQLRETLRALIGRRHYVFAASILRNDFFAYGLFGKENRGAENAFLSAEDVTDLAQHLAATARTDMASGAILPSMAGIEPLWLMEEVGQWDESCRERLDVAIREDDMAVIGMAILAFGGHHRTQRDDLHRLTDGATLIRRFSEVLSARGERLDPSARHALERALRF